MPYEELDTLLNLTAGTTLSFDQHHDTPRYRRMIVGRRRTSPSNGYTVHRTREVYNPRDDLKAIQRKIGALVSSTFRPHPVANGYVAKRSIITNANQHVGARAILHVDLSDFFGSISLTSVRDSLGLLFGGLSPNALKLLGAICCHNDVLAQGSPASPVLSNLVCYGLDKDLQRLAKSRGYSVTRYSDDISLSTRDACLPLDIARIAYSSSNRTVELGETLKSLIERRGFRINKGKLRFQRRPETIIVTGLRVEDRVRLPRGAGRRLRAILHRWERMGIAAMALECGPYVTTDAFLASISGRMGYFGQVEGKDNLRFRRLKATFEVLSQRDAGCRANHELSAVALS